MRPGSFAPRKSVPSRQPAAYRFILSHTLSPRHATYADGETDRVTEYKLHLARDYAAMGGYGKRERAMLPWLTYRRPRIERIDTEAEALIYEFGGAAHSEARQREHEASSPGIAKDWNRVALAVAQKTGKQVGLDTSTRMAMNADFSTDGGGNPQPKPRDYSEIRPIEELNRILGAKPAPFRVLFVGDAPNRGMSVLREVDLQVSDSSMAIVAAAKLEWPPQTVGLRIIDREGREVFERHRTEQKQVGAKPSLSAVRRSKRILMDGMDHFTDTAAREWGRLTVAIAHMTRRHVGPDTSTGMAMETNLTGEGNLGTSSRTPVSDLVPLDELMRLVAGAMTRSVRVPKRLRHWRRHAERKKVR